MRCVNGCCYGRISKHHGDYEKLCGESFWTLVSDDPGLWKSLIQPLGHKAKAHNDAFAEQLARLRTRLTQEFIQDYCTADYAIDWGKIVTLASATNTRGTL